jgi:YD repeat-containing protein
MEPYPPPLLLPAIAPEDSWEETYPDHVSGAAVGTAGYGIVEFSYDPAGRIRMKTDQQGDTCTFTYNLAGQLLSRAYRTAANSPSGTVADSDTFTYDRAGRMLTALSGRYANTVTLAYDHAGRLASEGLTIAGQTYSVGRTYDVRGLEATLSYPGGAVVQRSYTPRLQPLVPDRQAITVPVENLQTIATAIAKQKQMAREGILR